MARIIQRLTGPAWRLIQVLQGEDQLKLSQAGVKALCEYLRDKLVEAGSFKGMEDDFVAAMHDFKANWVSV